MKVYLTSRDGSCSATGEWNGSELTVLKGSAVKPGEPGNFKQMKEAKRCWNDKQIVDERNIVKKDVVFSSPSTAAQFITKRSVNGWVIWKTADKKTLKELRAE